MAQSHSNNSVFYVILNSFLIINKSFDIKKLDFLN